MLLVSADTSLYTYTLLEKPWQALPARKGRIEESLGVVTPIGRPIEAVTNEGFCVPFLGGVFDDSWGPVQWGNLSSHADERLYTRDVDTWTVVYYRPAGGATSAISDLLYDELHQITEYATPECLAFCHHHGLMDSLYRSLRKAEGLFSKVVSIRAEHVQFPPDEYEEQGHIAIRIEVGSDQDTAFREYENYTDWMLEAIEDDVLDFLLPTLRRVDDRTEGPTECR